MKLSRELKIGIVALIAIAFLIWGVNFLKGINVFKSSDDYYSTYDNIDGLIESGIVYLRGYKIGNVSAINFDSKGNGEIIVKYSIKENINIPKNSIFEIYGSSLVSGIKDIRLLLAVNDTIYHSGDTVPGRLDNGLASIINPVKEQAQITISKIDTILSSLSILLNEENLAEFHKTLNHVDNITASLDKSLASGGSLKMSFENMASITDNLKKSNAELKNMLANLSSVSDSLAKSKIKSTIENANSTLARTSQIFEKVDSGEGTLGLLVNNDSLYNNLRDVSASLDLLLNDLREHPKKYVHFSLFGKKEKSSK